MTVASIPSVFYEFAFNADPNQNAIPPYWQDLSSRVQYGWHLTRGRQYELDANETGTWTVELANADGALDPDNTASPYSPNILPYRPCRIRVVLGNNLLVPDQASAGEYAPLAPGPAPAWAGVTSFGTTPATIATVGAQAWQGSRVWSATVPAGTPGADLLGVSVRQVTAGQTYTFSAQAQAVTSGQSPAVYLAVNWIGTNGAVLSTTSGTPSTLTGASGIWTQLAVTGAAPAGAVAAVLRVVTSTTPTANSTVWMDGLQLEARGYATRWLMPWTPGTNLLPQTIASGSETMDATADTVTSWWTATAGTLAQAQNLTAAPSGQTTALAWTAPSGSTSLYALYLGAGPGNRPVADCVQVTPGQQYTASMWLSRSGPDATVTMGTNIVWYTSAGINITSSGSGGTTVPTSGWAQTVASGTAPAGAAWARVFIAFSSPTTLTGAETIYATGLQFEQGAAATAWADPGPPVFLFTGLVERWPRTFDDLSGTYGTSKLECVDVFAALAQYTLDAPFVNEVLALGPNFFYQLNDPAGSAACADTAGRRIAAPIESSPYGVGSLTFGSSIASTSSAGGFVGTPGPVATFNNNPGNFQLAETYVSIHKTTARPGPPIGTPWTRLFAFRAPAAPGGSNAFQMWCAAPRLATENSFCEFAISGDGTAFLNFVDSAGTGGVSWSSAGSVCDGNWHLAAIGVDVSTGNSTAWFDGASVSTVGSTGSQSDILSDVIGCYVQSDIGVYGSGFKGDAAFAAEFPFFFSNAQMTNLYNSWRSASAGESTGARYSRVLSWIGWTGPSRVAAGSTSQMGPATDVVGGTGLDGLNFIAATENGDSYANAAGVLTFNARSALYGARTPAVVFGEGQPVGNAGEWPCEIGAIDFDPSHIASSVQITQYPGTVFTAKDTTSARRYYPRQYQRTVNTASGSEAQDAASYLLSQLKDPHQRADVIKLHPAAFIGLFPIVARIDKNTRIRFVKRPVGAPATTLDGFVQRIAWTWSAAGDVHVEYQASPADLQSYWRIGALHTTLNTQASSGQNHATINALQDAAVNKLAQSLPSGYSLTFEPGTARAETVAIAPGGIPTTSLGYATATLTMATNLAFTHPAGSTVCELLPAGYTDPAAWDSASVLGASYTTIAGGGASGTVTVTVNALPDAATNPLGANWNTGDVIWLSPGTANFEAVTILSVVTTYPGYSTCQITLTANLAHSHTAGDWVCDPLPAGVTNPSLLAATTRVTY